MYVIATAGHVDHGKSALVRALTGMEPDRWQAERDRGLTIDLGYCWTTLPGPHGPTELAFVDVPGHERFIGNMIAGLGPAPAVLFIVSADEGWSRQSAEHLAAADGLGVRHAVVAITKADRADPEPALQQARAELATSSLAGARAVAVSARTGQGLDELRAALTRLLTDLDVPKPTARLRLWVDRSFSVRGAGTVVTGTLGEGTVRPGDHLDLADGQRSRRVRVRGVQALDQPREQVAAVARVALNLADVQPADVGRGSVLLAADRWPLTEVVDARLRLFGEPVPWGPSMPSMLLLHVGTAAVQVRVRPLADDVVRVTLPSALPLVAGDRALLRNPGTGHVLAGVEVLDTAPPELRRRGAGRRRGEELAEAGRPSLAEHVQRRGVLARDEARRLGLLPEEHELAVPGVRAQGDWLISEETWSTWCTDLQEAVAHQARVRPLDPTVSAESAVNALHLPHRSVLPAVVAAAGLRLSEGRVQHPDVTPDLGAAEPGLQRILARLAEDPWSAPERDELDAAGLGVKELAAAARQRRIVRLPGEIVLAPDGPARTMRVLAGLTQPFTLSEARQALGSTRRVVVPLLEHLDERGWTRRVDGHRRQIVR